MTGPEAVERALSTAPPVAIYDGRREIRILGPDHARLYLNGEEVGFLVRGIAAWVRETFGHSPRAFIARLPGAGLDTKGGFC